jgi:hypothetical protein
MELVGKYLVWPIYYTKLKFLQLCKFFKLFWQFHHEQSTFAKNSDVVVPWENLIIFQVY